MPIYNEEGYEDNGWMVYSKNGDTICTTLGISPPYKLHINLKRADFLEHKDAIKTFLINYFNENPESAEIFDSFKCQEVDTAEKMKALLKHVDEELPEEVVKKRRKEYLRYYDGCQFTIYINHEKFNLELFKGLTESLQKQLTNLGVQAIPSQPSDVTLKQPNISIRKDSGFFIVHGEEKAYQSVNPCGLPHEEVVGIKRHMLQRDPIISVMAKQGITEDYGLTSKSALRMFKHLGGSIKKNSEEKADIETMHLQAKTQVQQEVNEIHGGGVGCTIM